MTRTHKMDSVGATPHKKRYLYTVEKLHENVLLKKKTKSNLDKIELLQIYAKRRKAIIYNVPSSRDTQIIYYIFVRASGFRLSPSLSYKFEFYEKQKSAVSAMRKKTRKLMNVRNFTFVENPSFVTIKAFERITTGLKDDTNQLARAYAPDGDKMAADIINAITPGELHTSVTRKKDHMNIL